MKHICAYIKGAKTKYGMWGNYQTKLCPYRERLFMVLIGLCHIIEGAVLVITFGSYSIDLYAKVLFNPNIEKWVEGEIE